MSEASNKSMDEKKKNRPSIMAISIAIGAALGAVFGAVVDNPGFGIALGITVGVVVGRSREAKQRELKK